jgi:hypothetical protein
VVDAQPIGHAWAPVTRLVFDRPLPGLCPGDADGIGRTVVVKTTRVDGAGHGGPPHLRREIAGLRTAASSGLTAHVIAADHRAGWVVQSDLGSWPTLEAVLLGDDPRRAEAAMEDFARAIGRLHVTMMDRRAVYEAALADFGPADVSGGTTLGSEGPRRWHEVEQACAELGFPDPRAARNDIAYLRAVLDEPGRHGGLVHYDLNPTNALVTDHGVRLVDFEGCTAGHLGIDTVVLHYPFPTYSAHWAVLPERVIGAADLAYRHALAAAGGSGVLDGYDDLLVVGAGIMLTARVLRLPLIARTDQTPHDSWRRRAQLVQQIEVFGRLAERAGRLPALAGWFAGLAAAMSARWPDATTPPPPVFTAFADPA